MLTERPSLPKARTENLIVKELSDEVLIYDRTADKAHCLNTTAALVWKYCDGKTSPEAIAKAMEADQDFRIDEQLVWLALAELNRFDLLEIAPNKPTHLAGINRRQLVRNVGAAALALPLIMSIAAPTLAQVASCPAPGCSTPGCIPSGCPCSPNGNNPLCASGNCVGSSGTCQ